jgi:hypothetical protein
MQSRAMTDEPLDLDRHRGMTAQKATDLRRVLAKVENDARDLREQQAHFESQLLTVPAASWPDAAVKARYVLNLHAAGLSPEDTHDRDLIAAISEDFARLAGARWTRRAASATEQTMGGPPEGAVK